MLWRCARPTCLQRGQQASTLIRETSLSRAVVFIPNLRTLSRQASGEDNARPGGEAYTDGGDYKKSPAPASAASGIWNHNQLIAKAPVQQTVRVAGLVKSIRKQKRAAFAHISDGSTFQAVQAVLRPEDAKDIMNGAYVELEGTWKESMGAGQSHELSDTKVLQVGRADVESSPIQKKSMTVDHLRNYPHLRLRLPLYQLLTRTRGHVLGAMHAFYAGANDPKDAALYVQPPIITSSDCEGAGEVFTVSPKLHTSPHAAKEKEESHYFRTPKYLTVSSQLHLESFAASMGDVWTLTPAFRAEESDTGRHLAELWLQEAEFRGLASLPELTAKVAALIQYVATGLIKSDISKDLLNYHREDGRHRPSDHVDPNLEARWHALTEPTWQTITYTQAITELETAETTKPGTFRQHPTWNSGLQLEHERWIVTSLAKNKPIFVIQYPQKQKPFYMLPTATSHTETAGRETVACFDLLLPSVSETVGGSLREHRLEHLIQNMRDKGLLLNTSHTTESSSSSNSSPPPTTTDSPQTHSPDSYPYLQPSESLGSLQHYVDLRRYGSSAHGGFGMGLDRLLMYLTGVSNVRDVVAFPRTYRNCIA